VPDPTTVDATNKFFVGSRADGVMILRQPVGPLSQADALNLAAWLVALADPSEDEFPAMLAAVRST